MTAHQTETEAQPLIPQVEEDDLLRGILLALVVKAPRSKADLVAYLTSRHSSDSDVSSLSGDELCLAIDKRLSLLSEADLIKCQGETITITRDGFQLIELWRSNIEPTIHPARSPSLSHPEQTNEEILASIREMMVDDGKSSAEQPDTVPPPTSGDKANQAAAEDDGANVLDETPPRGEPGVHDASQSAMDPEDDNLDLTKVALRGEGASDPSLPAAADDRQLRHPEGPDDDEFMADFEERPFASGAIDEESAAAALARHKDTEAMTPGWLVENISRKMTVDRAVELEIRIAPELSARLLEGLRVSGKPVKHHVPVTTVMCLRLAAPKGGFSIFSHSPEAQLVRPEQDRQDNDNGIAAWHFTVIPTRRGTNFLRLTLSYRKITADGLVADSKLPDRTIEVQVRTNLGKLTIRTGAWTLTLVAGAALGAYFDKIATVLSTLIR